MFCPKVCGNASACCSFQKEFKMYEDSISVKIDVEAMESENRNTPRNRPKCRVRLHFRHQIYFKRRDCNTRQSTSNSSAQICFVDIFVVFFAGLHLGEEQQCVSRSLESVAFSSVLPLCAVPEVALLQTLNCSATCDRCLRTQEISGRTVVLFCANSPSERLIQPVYSLWPISATPV